MSLYFSHLVLCDTGTKLNNVRFKMVQQCTWAYQCDPEFRCSYQKYINHPLSCCCISESKICIDITKLVDFSYAIVVTGVVVSGVTDDISLNDSCCFSDNLFYDIEIVHVTSVVNTVAVPGGLICFMCCCYCGIRHGRVHWYCGWCY